MKKVKFAAQVFILAASFPVLFISGISHGVKSPKEDMKMIDSPSIKKEAQKEDGICKADCEAYSHLTYELLLKN